MIPRADSVEPLPDDGAAIEDLPKFTLDDDEFVAGMGHVRQGQLAIAYALAEMYSDKLLFVHDIGWHCWDGKRFAYDDGGAAQQAVFEVFKRLLIQSVELQFNADKSVSEGIRRNVRKSESAAGVAGVLNLAAALPAFAATVRDLDADPHLLNVDNGTLDLRTIELRPHSPADRITKVCRGAYCPDVESEVWQAFLARVLPDKDVRAFLQRLAGVGLIGKVIEHVLAILTGVGANGKSVLDKALRNALGDYACTAEPDLFMHRENAHPTGEMDLRGVRWVAVSESEKDRRLAEATMKRLTGGDTIRARRMRQDFVEFAPSHTPLLITNHLPRVSGDDAAIWRRIRVVPFDVVIPVEEQDRELDARLQLAADGILSWAVAGYRAYCERGLDEPASVRVATDAYRSDSDAVARFIEDECVTSTPVLKATTAHLFEAWQRWRPQEGVAEISRKAFGQSLDSHGYPVTDRDMHARWREGIALKVAEA
jgi:putative DNA primase/helicase